MKAALENQYRQLIDNWLWPIQNTANEHSELLDTIQDNTEKIDCLCLLNVAEQVQNVAGTSIVRDAWNRGQRLRVHGWIYGLKDGLVRDLEISISDEPALFLASKSPMCII